MYGQGPSRVSGLVAWRIPDPCVVSFGQCIKLCTRCDFLVRAAATEGVVCLDSRDWLPVYSYVLVRSSSGERGTVR